jgi:hypothetical protein
MAKNYYGLMIYALVGVLTFVLAAFAQAPHSPPPTLHSSLREPQIAFQVKGKWLSLTVTQAGQPLPDVGVEVFSATAQKFAAGETDDAGQGQFPLPPGPYCHLEVRVGVRVADTIKLQLLGDRVLPGAVLLSFGLKPCCRVPSRGSTWANATQASSGPTGLPLLARGLLSGGFVLVGVLLVVVAGRQYWQNRTQARANHV